MIYITNSITYSFSHILFMHSSFLPLFRLSNKNAPHFANQIESVMIMKIAFHLLHFCAASLFPVSCLHNLFTPFPGFVLLLFPFLPNKR